MFSNQDFNQLRKKVFKSGKLFKDPDFQPSANILKNKSGHKNILWKRPHEICSHPKFVVNGFSRYDVHQGFLGDCWFLAALATLAENKKLFHNVVPENNSFENAYAGIFHFRFWRAGKWFSIVIDDRLPVHSGKLLFMKAPSNEFWPALVEKAYAKFYGSYGAIEGGHCSEAMVDFTGGVVERYKLRSPPVQLFSILLKALKRGSLISVAVNRNDDTEQARKRKGIISGHAYSLTAARVINSGSKKEVKIVRVKNPWSNEIEWNGRFGDKSIEWQFVSEEIQRELKVQFADDGEFFMIFNEFLEHFDHIEFCHVSPGELVQEDESKQWFLTEHEGMFSSGDIYFPQIIVKLVDPDEHDDDDYCTLVLSLMQLDCRNTGLEHSAVSFEIYQLNNDDINKTVLNKEFFLSRMPVGTNKFEHFREICARFRLKPGHYVIVPKTLTYTSRKFLLRLFTESMNHGEQGKVIVKVNKKPQNLRNETRIEIFTEDDTPTPAAAAPQSTLRSSLGKHFSFRWWCLILLTINLLMFILGSGVIIYIDKGSISLRHF